MPYAVCGGIKMRFEVLGRPMPKHRPRVGRHGNIYTPSETKEYEKLVGWVAKCAGCKPLNGPIAVKLHLFLRGRSGDVDNYCKSILDGLNGVAYEDDDQVVELQVRKYKVKRKEEERVEIEIREFGEGM